MSAQVEVGVVLGLMSNTHNQLLYGGKLDDGQASCI